MNKKKILVFVLISYGFSWSIWGIQVLNFNFDLGLTISKWNHLVGGLGPLVGAIITTFFFGKVAGMKKYLRESFFALPSFKWILLGIGMPIVFFLIPLVIFGIWQNEWISLSEIGVNSKVPFQNVALIWLVWLLFFGLGEESGWRGVLFPELCKNYSARTATLYTAFIWTLWHLPIFLYDKDFQAMGIAGIFGWTVGLICGSLLLGWLTIQSRGSLWPVILWHGTFNLFTTSEMINPLYPGVMSGLVIVVSIWIARRYGIHLEKTKHNERLNRKHQED